LRKKRKKFGNVLMLLLLLFVLFYIFVEQKSITINAIELARNYSFDSKDADRNLLNKEIELTGKIKTYYEFEETDNLLELKTENDLTGVFIILKKKYLDEKAKSLTVNTEVTVYGKCLGLNPSGKEKFPNSIYIEAREIK